MALKAGRRRFAIFDAFGMATIALSSLMGSLQCKVGEGVIERLHVELNDIGLAAFMLGMTELAFYIFDFRSLAVEPRICRQVGRDVFVTLETQTALTFLRKWFVTAFAGLFIFGMRLDYVTRYDEFLE